MMTSDRLKQAAMAMFAERGYEGVSLAEIAGAVGVRTPSIYAHFASKEQLFLALFEDSLQADMSELADVLERTFGAPPLERMEAAFRHYTDLAPVTAASDFLRRSVLFPPKHLKEPLRKSFMGYEERLKECVLVVLEAGVAAGDFARQDPAALLALFCSMTNGLTMEQGIYDGETYQERQRILWDRFRTALVKG
ncbi:hypothetical protein AWU65_23940 [Paenibacillus glucanolyticus]|uniref:HTH tetR-type domain-containing protein n=1 Tax=Paenibacillus glucanolyticus TaxID=59843 RepID=A0A163M5W0_9BACL|nr:TetR/AcrR family transcriptional regulator [Paenibacillus glucanolyticus]KZS48768.1 hypothetical protein AWU65_23940 [Paenibacillus glucanolyticus]